MAGLPPFSRLTPLHVPRAASSAAQPSAGARAAPRLGSRGHRRSEHRVADLSERLCSPAARPRRRRPLGLSAQPLLLSSPSPGQGPAVERTVAPRSSYLGSFSLSGTTHKQRSPSRHVPSPTAGESRTGEWVQGTREQAGHSLQGLGGFGEPPHGDACQTVGREGRSAFCRREDSSRPVPRPPALAG